MSIIDYDETAEDAGVVKERGFHAAKLLADEVLQRAFREAELRVLRKWAAAETAEERESCHIAFGMNLIVQQELELMVNDGAVAADRLANSQD